MSETADPDKRAREVAREHREAAAIAADDDGPGGDIAEAVLRIADRAGNGGED